MRFRAGSMVVAVLLAMAGLVGFDSSANAADAKSALDAAGTRVGLCIHLGAGSASSPALTADLAAGSRMLVHGLAVDDAAVARARKEIDAKSVAGQAMVEKAQGGSLPYVNDLADMIVVDDPSALGAMKVSRVEVMRVLAPGGSLVTLEGGRWTKAVKPRPKEMDEWTHPQHGPDGSMVSNDKLVKFPLGLRWLDGLPMNINRWSACRAWVAAGGRVFLLTSNEIENIPLRKKPHWVEARDAWNGLLLWKVNCETEDDGAFLTWINFGALVTDGKCVYAVKKDKAVAFDAATGDVLRTYDSKYPPERMLLLDGVLVTSCWEKRESSKGPSDQTSLWATWVAAGEARVEAFEAATGKPLWAKDLNAFQAIASDGVVYILAQKGNPPTERTVVAVDLKTGRELWKAPHTRFGEAPDLQLNAAGKGFVVVAKRGDAEGLGAPKKDPAVPAKVRAIFGLAAADGHEMWKVSPSKSWWTPVVDGLVWCQSDKLDPMTGASKGKIGWGLGNQGCTPQAIVNGYLTRTRGGQYISLVDGKDNRYQGARGACIEGMVPANGMFYTAQNNCQCSPGQVYGFVAVGPAGDLPAADEFLRTRPTEKGPAFGPVSEAALKADWPCYRHDSERTASTSMEIPAGMKMLWKTPVAKPAAGPMAEAWKTRLASCLTAPVSAGDLVFAAETDSGRVFALNAANGKSVWTTTLGGRIDTPPTIYKGLSIVGCHDGWVYALRAKDGQLAWRTRVAPRERKMVAFGAIESVWPAVGTVAIHDGLVYANAGRTSESDGGIAVVALDPATGEFKWGKNIRGADRMNDMLAVRDGAVGWWSLRFDAKSGDRAAVDTQGINLGGMIDPTWTVVSVRKSGNAFAVGKTVGNILAWDDKYVASPRSLVARDKEQPLWTTSYGRTETVDAMAVAAGAAVYAGRAPGADGKAAGFLHIFAATDGKQSAQFTLDAEPTYDGLAVANGRIIMTLQNGSVVCFGKGE